jgi:NADPH:quinone reductase-like Zn-dependent oxidoreductase
VRAAALNHRDWDVVHGHYDPAMVLPRVPLSDGAGEVVDVGPEVTRFQPGDRVTTMMTRDWISGPLTPERFVAQLGTRLDGVLQEYVLLPEHAFVRMPSHLDFAQAATLPIAGLTAWSAITEAGVKAGDTVLIQGTGGVAMFALQLAKCAGARVIATTSREERGSALAAIGADVVLAAQPPETVQAAVLRATSGRGVDVVVELGGASNLSRSLELLRPGGSISVVGLLGMGAPIADFTLSMLQKNAHLRGIVTGSRDRYEELVRVMESQRLVPLVDRTFSFHEHRAALTYLGAGHHMGKVVIAF